MAKKLESNEDLVADLMTYSPYGALAQVFIMEAIQSKAEAVAKSVVDPDAADSFINPVVWRNIAIDIKERCDKFYNRHYVASIGE